MPVVIDLFEVGWSSRRTIEVMRLSIVIMPRIVHYECPIRPPTARCARWIDAVTGAVLPYSMPVAQSVSRIETHC
ncbi:hypothetical protein Asn12ST33_00455 [Cutibacterium acnes]|nr:hypothetical protein Asn12ST33_00455 [Cutibacterium acnes]